MRSVSYQIDRLQKVLGELDLRGELPQDESQQLLLALANATAIARRAAMWQRHHQATTHGSPSAVNCLDRKENRPASTSNSGVIERNSKDRESAAGKMCANAPVECDSKDPYNKLKRETISSIAESHNLSVEELRRFNSKLLEFNADEVLPPNTYITLKANVPAPRPSEEEDAAALYQRGEEAMLAIEATSMECPLPLAPLPNTQERHRCGGAVEDVREASGRLNSVGDMTGKGGSSARDQLLLLPSPSPIRSSANFDRRRRESDAFKGETFACNTTKAAAVVGSGRSEHLGACDNALSAAQLSAEYKPDVNSTESLNLKGSTLSTDCAVALSRLSSNVVPASLLSNIRAVKPPLPSFSALANDITPIEKRNNTCLSSLDKSHSATCGQLLHMEHSSNGPLATALPVTSEKHDANSNNGGSVGPLCPADRVSTGAQSAHSVFMADNSLSCLAEKGDYITSSRDQSVGGADFDTIRSIAIQYNLAVESIVRWNPHLKNYAVEDPLPPNLPVTLPISA
ncbi:unnamed protein product [Trypanosoma congolense IL3000]|uniref:WGS project CAEQ00000000 data, annotated contig 439 n=1 Tax=Trypanosoma congolense (strain IL3000) TaxID=1068625 RepID=F9WFY7_TRYCI|nr:unnamed protein product [Trypanosoma congolense IL3000]